MEQKPQWKTLTISSLQNGLKGLMNSHTINELQKSQDTDSSLPTAKRKVKRMTVEGTAFHWCAIRKHRINMFEFTSSNIEKTKPRNEYFDEYFTNVFAEIL